MSLMHNILWLSFDTPLALSLASALASFLVGLSLGKILGERYCVQLKREIAHLSRQLRCRSSLRECCSSRRSSLERQLSPQGGEGQKLLCYKREGNTVHVRKPETTIVRMGRVEDKLDVETRLKSEPTTPEKPVVKVAWRKEARSSLHRSQREKKEARSFISRAQSNIEKRSKPENFIQKSTISEKRLVDRNEVTEAHSEYIEPLESKPADKQTCESRRRSFQKSQNAYTIVVSDNEAKHSLSSKSQRSPTEAAIPQVISLPPSPTRLPKNSLYQTVTSKIHGAYPLSSTFQSNKTCSRISLHRLLHDEPTAGPESTTTVEPPPKVPDPTPRVGTYEYEQWKINQRLAINKSENMRKSSYHGQTEAQKKQQETEREPTPKDVEPATSGVPVKGSVSRTATFVEESCNESCTTQSDASSDNSVRDIPSDTSSFYYHPICSIKSHSHTEDDPNRDEDDAMNNKLSSESISKSTCC